jgi:hypothetical protein
MDIEKLKVAELRTELANRGLDTKGTKPVNRPQAVKIFTNCDFKLVDQFLMKKNSFKPLLMVCISFETGRNILKISQAWVCIRR